MDGVIAVFWTDLDPGKVTDCPQTHHCGGGGNVYYKKDADHLVRQSLRLMRVLGLRDASSLQVPKIACQTHSSALLASLASAVLSVAASASFLCILSSRPSSMQRCSRGRGTTSTTYLTQVRLSRLYCGTVATCSSSTSTCKSSTGCRRPPTARALLTRAGGRVGLSLSLMLQVLHALLDRLVHCLHRLRGSEWPARPADRVRRHPRRWILLLSPGKLPLLNWWRRRALGLSFPFLLN